MSLNLMGTCRRRSLNPLRRVYPTPSSSLHSIPTNIRHTPTPTVQHVLEQIGLLVTGEMLKNKGLGFRV